MAKRRISEQGIIENIIDFDPGEVIGFSSIVDWYAYNTYVTLARERSPAYKTSPITTLVAELRKVKAKDVILAYSVLREQSNTETEEQLLLQFCRERFRKGKGIQLPSPRAVVISEVDSALRNLIEMLEEQGEVLEEDLPPSKQAA